MEEDTNKIVRRNNDIDDIKGILVLLMVFFHCASMAMNNYPDLRIATKILNWLHFGFILISGFLCGWYYSPKIKWSKWSVKKRLKIRGIKLIVLFALINLFLYSSQFLGVFSIDMLRQTVSSTNAIINNYILSMNGDLFGFQVLYYIGLFLLIVSFIIDRINSITAFLITVFMVFIAIYGKTLLFLTFGFIGYYLGLILENNCTDIFEKNRKKLTVVIPILLFSYLIFIDLFRSIMIQVRQLKPIVFMYEIILWMILGILLKQYISSDKFDSLIGYFSKYTLFGYVIQMFIIRVGYIMLTKIGVANWCYYFVNVLFTVLILYISIRLLDLLRKKYKIADNGYRLVFQ